MSEQTSSQLLRIGEAARRAGVSTQTVEYYVMLGLVTPINQPPGSRRRFFDDRLVRRIRLIRELNETGYTLREIRQTWLRRR
jgi:DNA-binding transcriptional MerR regulator